MKTLSLLLILCVTVLGFSLCKSNRYNTTNLPEKQIRWGTGGGFTAIEKTYILLENGQIFQPPVSLRDTLKEIKPAVKSKVAKNIYEIVEENGLSTLDYMHPGNLYSFIEVVNGDVVNRISWGDRNSAPPEAVTSIYEQLNTLLPKQQ
ncbi:MAG: hypothetical protein IPL65_15190 [Lewinellaceae bacterium]|nr:hypothetical protein [Lewinellaceae bacterium]